MSDLTDRQAQNEAFRQLLNDKVRWVMPICGLSGMGKTFLVQYLFNTECAHRDIPYASLDLSSSWLRGDYLHILDDLETQLRHSVASSHWDAYRRERADWERRLASQKVSLTQHIDATDGGTVQTPVQRMEVGNALEETLRREEERVRDGITRSFAGCLAHDRRPLVVFMDGWENSSTGADTSLGSWLVEGLFKTLHAERPPFRLVIASQEKLAYPSLETSLSPCAELQEFTLEDSAEFLSRHGIRNPEVQRLVFGWVHGHPLLTDMLADQGEEALAQELTADSERPPASDQMMTDWVRQRIRSRLPPPYDDLLTYGVVLRHFDLDTLQALFPDKQLNPELFARFTAYSFVKRVERGWKFYDLVRLGQLHELREFSERAYKEYHGRAAAYYADRANKERRADLQRTWTAEMLYHSFAVDEPAALLLWWQEMRGAERRWEREWWRLLLELPAAWELHIGEEAQAWAQIGWGRFFMQGAQWDGALRYLSDGLACMERLRHAKGQAEALMALGDLCFKRGEDWDLAANYLGRSLLLSEQAADQDGILKACNRLGSLCVARSQWPEALGYLERSRQLAAERGNLGELARAMVEIADTHFVQGQWEEAVAGYQEGLRLYEQVNAAEGIILTTNRIGLVRSEQGRWPEALVRFEHSLVLCQQQGNELRRGETLLHIGHIYEDQGRWSRALQSYTEAWEVAHSLGDLVGEAAARYFRGEVNEVLGDLDAALADFRMAWEHSERIGLRTGIADAISGVACIYMKQDQPDAAADHFERSRAIYEQIGDLQGLAVIYNNKALLACDRGDVGAALAALQDSLAIKRKLGDIPGQLATLRNLSRIHEGEGDAPAAVETCQELVRLDEQINDPALVSDLLRLQELGGQLADNPQPAGEKGGQTK